MFFNGSSSAGLTITLTGTRRSQRCLRPGTARRQRDNPGAGRSNATLRVTVDDNGNPGIQSDTIGITVWAPGAPLRFSSNWDGTGTVEQAIAAGSLHVSGGAATGATK